MGTNDGGIHEVQVPLDLAALLRFGLQVRQDALPDPGLAPAVEPARHRAHRPIAPWQVAPRRAGAMDPQNAVQNAPVVLARTPGHDNTRMRGAMPTPSGSRLPLRRPISSARGIKNCPL